MGSGGRAVVNVQLRLELVEQSVRGWLCTSNGQRRPFVGWLQLTQLLTDAADSTGSARGTTEAGDDAGES